MTIDVKQTPFRLTPMQRFVVKMRASSPYSGTISDGNDERTVRSLIDKGLLAWSIEGYEYNITTEGIRWAARHER